MTLRSDIARLRRDVERLRQMREGAERSLDPVSLLKGAGIEPDAWQRRMLESGRREIMLLVTRQGGKSTAVSSLALSTALDEPGSLVLVIAPAQRQSQELFEKVKWLYRSNKSPVPTENDSLTSYRFVNGSRIITLPGKASTIRSYSPDLVIIDEAAFLLDDVYQAVRPMLIVSGGRLVAVSTPFGKRGWFHHEWTQGGEDWERILVTAHDVPRITPEALERERKALPDMRFRAEFLCEFTDTVDGVFRHEDVMAMFTDDIEPLFPDPYKALERLRDA